MNAAVEFSEDTSIEVINNFNELAKINVNKHTEKKGKFTYLSWTFAVSEAMKADPLTVWAFKEPMVFPDKTMMVHCDVVHCHVGSLEIKDELIKAEHQVHCHVGSLENPYRFRAQRH